MSALLPLLQEHVRPAGLSLAGGAAQSLKYPNVAEVYEELKKALGADTVNGLVRAFNEALNNEMARALNTDNLEQELPSLAYVFFQRFIPLSLSVAAQALSDRDKRLELRTAERRMAVAVAQSLRATGYAEAEDLIKGLLALLDHDLWLFDNLELVLLSYVKPEQESAEGFMSVDSRLSYELVRLNFTWAAAASAVLGRVSPYREHNRDLLAKMTAETAESVLHYMDLLSVLLLQGPERDLKIRRHRVLRELTELELKYGIISEDFYSGWTKGLIPEPKDPEVHGDYIVWEQLYEELLSIDRRLTNDKQR